MKQRADIALVERGLVDTRSKAQALIMARRVMLGGVLFLGAFYLALRRLTQLGRVKPTIADPELRHLQPFVTGILASYTVGMLSLTLPYVLPTYTVLAFAASYANMTTTDPALPTECFDLKLWGRLALVGVIFLVCAYVFVRIFMLRG